MTMFARIFCTVLSLGWMTAASPLAAAGPDATADPAVAAPGDLASACGRVGLGDDRRVVCADLVALEQTLVYNRFGSFNPYGMVFALRRDVVPSTVTGPRLTADHCAGLTGTESHGGSLGPGAVRLKDCKRPRPVVLRVNVGDLLLVRVENLMAAPEPPDFSRTFCRNRAPSDEGRRRVRLGVREGDALQVRHGEADCPRTKADATRDAGDVPDWPRTRRVNFVVQGLTPMPDPDTGRVQGACLGIDAVEPGASFLCLYRVDQEGTYFLASPAAPAGGEGDGGSVVHGLFGAVVAQRQGSRWYRSQVSRAALDTAWPRQDGETVTPDCDGEPLAQSVAGGNHVRTGTLDYEAIGCSGTPILNMARALDSNQADFHQARRLELVHADLNAIIWCDPRADTDGGTGQDCRADRQDSAAGVTTEPAFGAFREFSVFFHDELKTFYTRNFRDLDRLGQLAGVRDGFAINYGASGMGAMLLANRKGIGPAADCMECLYEEFFLTSWANGDPALLEWYADDPSNVHHSYLNDPVVYRNFHAGPKETHVFHLHAHQWFAGNDPNRGSYLDSQTVGPQQGFTYNIYHGGLRNEDGSGKGWWDTQGSGNRNRTLGDSIFHCHLYPHFAQGMWALWRVHDVFEDGTRRLPDGQADGGLSLDFVTRDQTGAVARKRTGSVDPATGAWLDPDTDTGKGLGTPIPAIVPLPGTPQPLLPTYAAGSDIDTTGPEPVLAEDAAVPMPGYPFYIAGRPGHRPPQAPLDIARNLGANPDQRGTPVSDLGADPAHAVKDERQPVPTDQGEWLNGGLDRHVVADGAVRTLGFDVPSFDPGGATGQALEYRRSLYFSQVIAKAFALGDLGGHLTSARLDRLSPWGETLERAAMGFHFNGRLVTENGGTGLALKLAAVDGSAVAPGADRGAYATPIAPLPRRALPGSAPTPTPTGQFHVNGSAPKPGAPFADPCGVARAGTHLGSGKPLLPRTDPLTAGWIGADDFLPDPHLDGYRRYEVSAVQLDMVVNKAGWHDPQARINVLTANSDTYKQGEKWRISPYVSDKEEPFFFRALSGECVEFRHTNELPKELELDDFQVRTPTDTIGQHIHLVKFDVTASDGSGNGWNYEDGTFAPDEIAARLCAEKDAVVLDALWARVRAAMTDDQRREFPENTGFCEWRMVLDHDLWRLERSRFPFLFQTTTQRWFVDPILSNDGPLAPVDRTMRTVFTHDHFGPSSIQQHGFYSALVVEPPARLQSADETAVNAWYPKILPPVPTGENDPAQGRNPNYGPLPNPDREQAVAWGSAPWVGAHKRIVVAPDFRAAARDPAYFQHPNYREHALSIADFALLYDPRDREASITAGVAAADRTLAGRLSGMAKLYCEAYWRFSPSRLGTVCGTPAERDRGTTSHYYPGEVPPAWLAAGAYRDDAHRRTYSGDLFLPRTPPLQTEKPEIVGLGDHLWRYRVRAAGRNPDRPDLNDLAMARPVAAPERPESISVDHHDPYLVNYRGAPIPLRIGTKDSTEEAPEACEPMDMARPGDGQPGPAARAVADGIRGTCSITHQRAGERGDMGLAFSSHTHGDPETPLLEAYQGERIVIRMIQGAQEVQHMFGIAGQPFKRSTDQAWPQGMQPLGRSAAWNMAPTLQSDCFNRDVIRRTKVREYRRWLDTAPRWTNGVAQGWQHPGIDPLFWQDYEKALAECDNIEGFTFAQEIGISEHFEMQGSLRADVGASVEAVGTERPEAADRDSTSIPTQSSDYFYSFGTVDALWNGAWGLMRIYQGKDSRDPVTEDRIGDRLSMVPTFGPRLEAASTSSMGYQSNSGLACPLPSGPENPQRFVDAVIVAVETRRAFPDQKGTVYGEGLYDPDGLFLALLSPVQLGLAGIQDEGFARLTVRVVLAAIAAAYPAQPEPFVLRVRAGDCLRLRVLNLLGEDTTGARDLLGDALMPRIVPLNTDPVPHLGREPVARGATTRATVGRLDLPKGRQEGVRPSARLALSFGLPGLDLIRTLPLGYGFNAHPLDAGLGAVTKSDVIYAYAGRFRMDLPADSGDTSELLNSLILRDVARRLAALPAEGAFLSDIVLRLNQALDSADVEAELGNVMSVETDDRPDPFEQVLSYLVTLAFHSPPKDQGEEWETIKAPLTAPLTWTGCGTEGCDDDIDTLNAMLPEIMADAIATALNERTHWIPYAFGAVPVRPVADPVSQTLHGLFGAIDVVPRTWTAVDDDGIACPEAPDERGYLNCLARHVPGARTGHGFRWTATGTPGGQARPLREFVLFWQDGMNHWDDRSPLVWRWAGVSGGRSLGNMVPDCPVCDDSYDLGEAGFSYRSPTFSRMLRQMPGMSMGPDGTIRRSDDLNAFDFPADFFTAASETPRLTAMAGEQVVIRVVHPGGRARQRAFVMNGYSYDDLFPGFGFPRGALLAPGKAISAWLRPNAGTTPVLWHDGPTFLRASGTWGLLDVQAAE